MVENFKRQFQYTGTFRLPSYTLILLLTAETTEPKRELQMPNPQDSSLSLLVGTPGKRTS